MKNGDFDMAKSKLLKELVNNEVSLLQGLDRLYLISYSLDDDDVCEWVKKEKAGYESDDNIPSYRKTTATPIGTYQIISSGKIETYHDTPLPVTGIPKETMEQFNNWFVRDSVISLEKQRELSDKGQRSGFPLDPVCFSWFEKNTNIIMRKAMLCVSSLSVETILCSIKTKVIDLLLLYEDKFGELDSLDIELNKYKTKEINEVKIASKAIIDGTFTGKTKIIIKNSNLGSDNIINKETDITTNVSVENKEKRSAFGWLKKLFKKK